MVGVTVCLDPEMIWRYSDEIGEILYWTEGPFELHTTFMIPRTRSSGPTEPRLLVGSR